MYQAKHTAVILSSFSFLILLLPLPLHSAQAPAATVAAGESKQMRFEDDVTQGALRVKTDEGKIVECPLTHTDVKAEVSGFIARVVVTQTFANPFDKKIEAVYVFPLSHTSAVDAMTMVIGDRRTVVATRCRNATGLPVFVGQRQQFVERTAKLE